MFSSSGPFTEIKLMPDSFATAYNENRYDNSNKTNNKQIKVIIKTIMKYFNNLKNESQAECFFLKVVTIH